MSTNVKSSSPSLLSPATKPETDRQTHIERKQYLHHSLRSLGGDNYTYYASHAYTHTCDIGVIHTLLLHMAK